MRRPTNVEAMLLATVLLWALNLSMSRTILTHGFQPLAYATVRYGLAAVVFAGIALGVERSLAIERRDLLLVGAAALAVWLNQLGFVYALRTTTASVVGLVLGATPIFAALFGFVLRTERLHVRFWIGAAVSFAGVALVAMGSGTELSGGLGGILLGMLTAATWAVYAVIVTPLMRRYSPVRVSALVLGAAWLGIALTGVGQSTRQDYGLGVDIWALVLAATLGPLVLTNVLWFRSLHRIGPARATLATNLQPFVAAVLAVVLLGEAIGPLQLAGGVLIGVGIALARRRSPRGAQPRSLSP
jgi:drug/metabolite transporter (DMT)-like permease